MKILIFCGEQIMFKSIATLDYLAGTIIGCAFNRYFLMPTRKPLSAEADEQS